MRVAVIGRGNIGGTIGRALAGAGHDVVYGTRDPSTAVGDGTVSPRSALRSMGPMQCFSPYRPKRSKTCSPSTARRSTESWSSTRRTTSARRWRTRQRRSRTPRRVHATRGRSTTWVRENFADPDFDDVNADLIYSSAEGDRGAVEELISPRLRPLYLGPDQQDTVDRVLPVWFALVQARGNGHIAFKLLEK